MAGTGRAPLPTSGEVAATIRRHAELLAGLQTDPEQGERRALTDLRKHMAWYLKGYPVGGDTRRALAMVSSFAELDTALAALDPDLAVPRSPSSGRRAAARARRRPRSRCPSTGSTTPAAPRSTWTTPTDDAGVSGG